MGRDVWKGYDAALRRRAGRRGGPGRRQAWRSRELEWLKCQAQAEGQTKMTSATRCHADTQCTVILIVFTCSLIHYYGHGSKNQVHATSSIPPTVMSVCNATSSTHPCCPSTLDILVQFVSRACKLQHLAPTLLESAGCFARLHYLLPLSDHLETPYLQHGRSM